jgi:hypothetical protein
MRFWFVVVAVGFVWSANYDRFKLNGFSLSIETDVIPVQINMALNREGVELPFNQSYRFEVTTNSLGKYYITS